MSLANVVVGLGYPVLLFVVALLIEQPIADTDPLLSVPGWLRTVAGGIALGGPWLLYWRGHLQGLTLSTDVMVPITLTFVLWFGAMRLVGVGARGTGTC